MSAATLAVAVQQENQRFEERVFDNTAPLDRTLIAGCGRTRCRCAYRLRRPAFIYWTLRWRSIRPRASVAVLNPKLIHRFAQTLRRSKTDSADAQGRCEYSCRMPFVPWSAPELSGLRLRTISRHIQSLVVEQTRQNNRLHNAEKSATTPRCVVNDLKRSMASLKLRIVRLRREALELVRTDEAMRKRFDLLVLIPGIAAISALQLLGELAPLSPEMSVRQWVAHSGSICRTRSRELRCISRRASAAFKNRVTCAAHSTCLPRLRFAAIRI